METDRTTIRFTRSAMISQATLTADDGGRPAYVFCAIPGGKPWMTFDPKSQQVISITNAPSCDNHGEFKAFVSKRFGQ